MTAVNIATCSNFYAVNPRTSLKKARHVPVQDAANFTTNKDLNSTHLVSIYKTTLRQC